MQYMSFWQTVSFLPSTQSLLPLSMFQHRMISTWQLTCHNFLTLSELFPTWRGAQVNVPGWISFIFLVMSTNERTERRIRGRRRRSAACCCHTLHIKPLHLGRQESKISPPAWMFFSEFQMTTTRLQFAVPGLQGGQKSMSFTTHKKNLIRALEY